jgi:hypothetical protein
VAGEQFAVGRLEERSSAQSKNRRTRQARQDEVEVMVLDGAEAAFTARGEDLWNGAVNARDLEIEIGERAAKMVGEKVSKSAFASPHESDEDQ